MKTEDLKAQGLTDEQISFVMAENGKDISKVQKKVDDMTAELEKEKGRADVAEETLKKFDGVDVEAIKTELSDWQKKAKDAEADYNKKIADRDFNDLLKESINSANGLNHKAITALLDVDTLKASKNQKEDIASAIKALSEAEDSKMLFKVDNSSTPHFTSVTKNNANNGMTKDSIMAIKDTAARQKAIADNMSLFQ